MRESFESAKSVPISADYQRLTELTKEVFLSSRLSTYAAGKCYVKVPESKSIANRAFLLASLADGVSKLTGMACFEKGEGGLGGRGNRRSPKTLLEIPDTQLMIDACTTLGAQFRCQGETLEVVGVNGTFGPCDSIYVGNSGTCARFLSAALLLGKGSVRLIGTLRMGKRPMGELLTALRSWGARIDTSDGSLPFTIHAGPITGGELVLKGHESSQFLSALLMIAPFARKASIIHIDGPLVSPSYVDMTISVMRLFGVEVEKSGRSFYVPAQQRYRSASFSIPGDASSASYFFALAAITGWEITVGDLADELPQSDLGFASLLGKMGCRVEKKGSSLTVEGSTDLRGIDIDMCDMSDIVPSLAVVALFATSPTHMRNISHIRLKECDRLSALRTELAKCLIKVEETEDSLVIHPLSKIRTEPFDIETYNDHRIAMAFSVLALRIPGIRILNPSCVGKTYPSFFQDMEKVIRTARSS